MTINSNWIFKKKHIINHHLPLWQPNLNVKLIIMMKKTQNNSFPGEYEHLVPLPSVFVGVMLEPLTFRRTGWRRGWRACSPCPPRSEPCRRTSAGCSAWRTSASPGWCPGGPGSPHTGRWCDRLPVDSSLDPCSPPGHLTRLKEAHAPSN